MGDCPSRAELMEFTTGRLSDLAAEAVAGHVAHCAACREVLGDLDGFSDPLIQGLRAAQSEPQLNPDDTRRAVERAIALDLALGARDAAGFLSPEPMRQRAIPVRCPHCRAHIELSTAEGIGAMTCGICGESFAVAAEEPLQEMAAGLSRRIAHFELIERAGEGGFGTVWKARDTRLGRTVALKIPHLGGNAAFEPLLHEARIAAGLAHPHIVAVLEVGCDGHPPYIASELIDGENLAAKLRGQPLTPREAAELVLRLAEALQVAHAAGVIHRDLKPENILIDQAGEPHISDFGLARGGVDGITVTLDGRILGTPAYMSPEQARGQSGQADARSDLFSLGVILYEMLTGQVPFRGDLRTLVARILFEEPASPRTINRHVPRDLATIAMKCLEKKPSRRYESAGALAGDLRRFLGGEPIRARAVGPGERFWRWCLRRPWVAGLGTVVVLLSVSLVATALAAWWRQQQIHRSERESLYLLEIGEAQEHWLANEKVAARESLSDCPEEFRNLEWHLLEHVVSTPKRRLPNAGRSVEFGPDGQWLVTSGGNSNMLKYWDVPTHQLMNTGGIQPAPMVDVRIAPDGKRVLVTSNTERCARVWHRETGKLLCVVGREKHAALRAAFSPDASRILSYGDQNTLFIWDTATGEELLALGGGEVIYTMAVSPVGTRVAVSSGKQTNAVTVWDYATGAKVLEVPTYGALIASLAYSPDGQRLVLGERLGAGRVWRLEPLEPHVVIAGPLSGDPCLTFDVPGNRIAGEGADKCVHVWDAATGHESLVFRGHVPPTRDIAFSRDGRTLAGGSAEDMVYLWDTQAEQGSLPLPSLAAKALEVKCSPDGELVAGVFDGGTIRLWRTADRQVVRDLKVPGCLMRTVGFSPDGTRLVAGDDNGKILVFHIPTARVEKELAGHAKSIRSVTYSPDGRRIASGGLSRIVVLHDARTGVLETCWKLSHAVRAVAWSPDGTRLVAGDRRGLLVAWSVPSRKELWRVTLPYRIWSLAWSPDGSRLAIARGDSVVQINAASNGSPLQELGPPGDDIPIQVAFSPKGDRLAVATQERSISLWEIPSGRPVLVPIRSPRTAATVALDPRGRFLVSALLNGSFRLWPTAPQGSNVSPPRSPNASPHP